MKTNELRRLIRETGEAAVNLINRFEEMVDNTSEKHERELLEKLKKALVLYKIKKGSCEKNGLSIKISVDPSTVKIKTLNPSFEVLLTKQDLKIFRKMRISIE